MADVTLQEFARTRTQSEVAELLAAGNQSAVSQMLASDRKIFVRTQGKKFEAYEIKPIGLKAKKPRKTA